MRDNLISNRPLKVKLMQIKEHFTSWITLLRQWKNTNLISISIVQLGERKKNIPYFLVTKSLQRDMQGIFHLKIVSSLKLYKKEILKSLFINPD